MFVKYMTNNFFLAFWKRWTSPFWTWQVLEMRPNPSHWQTMNFFCSKSPLSNRFFSFGHSCCPSTLIIFISWAMMIQATFGCKKLLTRFTLPANICQKKLVMGRTPFYQTWNGLKHHFFEHWTDSNTIFEHWTVSIIIFSRTSNGLDHVCLYVIILEHPTFGFKWTETHRLTHH